jgi:alkanesulfonate monooxygenase SsuD/methylene tetrahydromethanopterin reductase-like flavin-dependent oxidoreductase (luciferase family)
MPDYGQPLQFGLSITPDADDLSAVAGMTSLAESAGYDLIAIQDHAYQPRFLDTWTLLTYLAARTERVRFLPDVADLALRPPAMLAKAAASLDVLTGGRVDLGVGSGGFPDAITGMGGPERTPGQAVTATEEAMRILRLALAADRPVVLHGEHYDVRGYRPGPPPAHPIPIWLGVVRPRMLAVTGRLADGWICPLNIYVGPGEAARFHELIDQAAVAAGRQPADVRRLYNVLGSIGLRTGGRGLNGPTELWADTLASWVTEPGFDTFVFWPTDSSRAQAELFAREVLPAVRARVADQRTAAPLDR